MRPVGPRLLLPSLSRMIRLHRVVLQSFQQSTFEDVILWQKGEATLWLMVLFPFVVVLSGLGLYMY